MPISRILTMTSCDRGEAARDEHLEEAPELSGEQWRAAVGADGHDDWATPYHGRRIEIAKSRVVSRIDEYPFLASGSREKTVHCRVVRGSHDHSGTHDIGFLHGPAVKPPYAWEPRIHLR